MCTLVAAFRQFPGFPLIVAANRDELLDRPAGPLRRWEGERFVAPVDLSAGGTWLGVSGGLFVGVTNRFGVARDERRESRGALVVEALRHTSARKLHRALQAPALAGRFNAFHLLYADGEDAYVTWSDGERVRQEELPPGLHVVTERSLGGDDRARTERIRATWAELAGRPPEPEALMTLLRQHAPEDPLGSICVHAPAIGYGTRSSLVLYLAPDARRSRLWWAEGPPCLASFADRSELLREG